MVLEAGQASTPAVIPCNETRAVSTLLSLLKAPGQSCQEAEIQRTVLSHLHASGVDPQMCFVDDAHQRSPHGGEAGNLIVKLPGTIRGPRRLLMAHVDTVPICVGTEPQIDGDYIRSQSPATGLGGDDRGGVGVVITAIREILENQLPHPPLTLFFPVQEEIGLCGARYGAIRKLGKPALAFNWDGNLPHVLCIGATGADSIDVEIEGIASHAGVHPELGVSATAIASLAIADLVQQGWHGLIRKGRKSGTSNIGVIQGGEATNVVTSLVRLRAEARSHDPAFRARIVQAYQRAFRKGVRSIVSADGRRGKLRFQAELKYEAFRLDPESRVVQTAAAALRGLGLEPELVIGNGGLDANWMVAHGIPAVTLGCGQRSIHTVNEHLHIPSYLQACRAAVALATAKFA
ncbi:MAG: M20/M25/M40 family metallo-hydrolase [Planctomycetaceae bacterium]|nr:M20/M25/M40 family metallo-hydrolase [Planctomycetaceae bacterium]